MVYLLPLAPEASLNLGAAVNPTGRALRKGSSHFSCQLLSKMSWKIRQMGYSGASLLI